ncbi:MAG: citrate synthase/methylcitrate synthase [Gemmatimonadetes bacterium]|nr:citrate synthase/methylcitrate synthase [Gemmatimonadota bacterium]
MDVKIGRGLEGAIAATSKIGYVNGQKGWLVYAGYNCFDLAQHSTYEETAFLLLYGKLPTSKELSDFSAKLVRHRSIPESVVEVMRHLPVKEAHPMGILRTAVSAAGNFASDSDNVSVDAEREVSIQLIAEFPTIVAAIGRIRQGKDPIAPNPDLGHAANFLYMLTGEVPDEDAARVMDVALILHADHGMNASTFTTMVVNATLSDMYSSVVAGIGSLKGSLHGGANERVLYQLEEIGKPENTLAWFKEAQKNKVKVMGMGHRVYKAYDPRGRIFGPLAGLVSDRDPDVARLYEVAKEVDRVVSGELKDKKIYPNVDFYSGLVYKALGIETPLFTPIFAVSRVAGWTARALEHLADNRLFRPRAIYTGETELDYRPISER